MRRSHPFLADDLASLEQLFEQMAAVLPMREIAAGNGAVDVIGLRHDVDDNKGSFQAALDMARWEYERGYRSTYFLLHSASYWDPKNLGPAIEHFQGMGHEVGIHVNAIAQAIRTGRHPDEILADAVDELRMLGAIVIGSAAHGDELCRSFNFVNDEQFFECPRPGYGGRGRTIGPSRGGFVLEPKARMKWDLMYDSNWLPRRFYGSDSGGVWSKPWEEIEKEGLSREGQLHLLIHPDWWGKAFE